MTYGTLDCKAENSGRASGKSKLLLINLLQNVDSLNIEESHSLPYEPMLMYMIL